MPKTNDEYTEPRSIVTLTGGDGKGYIVTTIKAEDRVKSRDVDVFLPDLSGFQHDKYGIACQRCGGGWDQDQRTIFGGWMPKIVKRDGCWHEVELPCPDCAFGAYRKLQDPARPFFVGWAGCSALDIGFLTRHLHNDNVRPPAKPTPTLREALDTLQEPERSYGPKANRDPDFYLKLYQRLLAGIEQQELMEQYQTTSGRDRQGADLF